MDQYQQDKQWSENSFTEVKNRNKKNKKKNPPVNITPTDSNKTTNTKTPPVAYADIVFRYLPKPPKEIITQEQIDAVPELKQDIQNDRDSDREPHKHTTEELEIIRKQIDKSSHIIGIHPSQCNKSEKKQTNSKQLRNSNMKITNKLLLHLQKILL